MENGHKPKREEVAGGWRRQHNEVPCILDALSNIMVINQG